MPMTAADSQALAPVQALLRQLRDIKGVRELRPGVFHCRGSAFVQFMLDDGSLVAELKKPGGSGHDRYPVEQPPAQRKLVEDAKRRAARGEDD